MSSYAGDEIDPRDLTKRLTEELGNTVLLVGRVGYRFGLVAERWTVEAGLAGRCPLPGEFREAPGIAATAAELSSATDDIGSDFGGEPIAASVDLYLRVAAE